AAEQKSAAPRQSAPAQTASQQPAATRQSAPVTAAPAQADSAKPSKPLDTRPEVPGKDDSDSTSDAVKKRLEEAAAKLTGDKNKGESH
ncbi:hypothetical protein, partial [Dietzia sp.]|uniref:hypothetical protein n=1 Tax=Dietzia sp. TaxID=1871616 RepID=UPI003FA59F1D